MRYSPREHTIAGINQSHLTHVGEIPNENPSLSQGLSGLTVEATSIQEMIPVMFKPHAQAACQHAHH